MREAPSVLLADADPHSREALINQLLVAGVTDINVAGSRGEVLSRLAALDFDVLVVDYELFDTLDGDGVLDRYRDTHNTRVILMVDDDHDELLGRATTVPGRYVCILKSSAKLILRSVVTG